METGKVNKTGEAAGQAVRQWIFGSGPCALEVKVELMGSDLVVLISGGQAHVGSIAVAHPRPSLEDKERLSATTSTYNFVGHKDDYLAQPMAHKLATATGRNVVVLAGFHIAAIDPAELQEVMNNLKSAMDFLCRGHVANLLS